MEENKYDQFENQLKNAYPEMFSQPYGGVAVDEGWWPIIKALCAQIHSYTKWRNTTRQVLLKDNPHNVAIPEEIPQVVVTQIKEKFGGLRFYYNGGDTHISGMVRMAESWAALTCEICGNPGEIRPGGWITTLCDFHDQQRKASTKHDD